MLQKCLLSLGQYGADIRYDVIVIDNASEDGSAEMVRHEFPEHTLIANNTNRGFAAAVNQGIRASSGDVVLLLNPDTEIRESTLRQLLQEFAEHEETGIAGGKIQNEDGTIQPSVRAFPTVLSQLLISLKLHHILHLPSYAKYMMEGFDYAKRQETDQVMGAFFGIRRKVIDQIGLFDERFFLWFEEVDFCKRAKNAGWKVVYIPGATLIHQGGQSFAKLSPIKRQGIFLQSLRQYMSKHKGSAVGVLFAAIYPVSMLLAALAGALHSAPTAYEKRIKN